MKNHALAVFTRSIPYVKELRAIAGTVTAAILMQQLDFRFSQKPDGFYKFLEPCNHAACSPGDSWVEELGFSKEEFRSAWAKIGFSYKSRSQYLKSGDKFQGALYCCYFDRVSGLTHYFRNHEVVDRTLDDLAAGRSLKPETPMESVNRESQFLEVGKADPDLYTENTYRDPKCNKADENPPREKNVSHLRAIASGDGSGSDKSISADPNRSVKSSVGNQKLLPPSPCSAPPPSPVRAAIAPHFCTDDHGIIRFPTFGPHKLAGRFALRSTQVWLCAEELDFEFSKDDKGVFYASDPLNGGWVEERTMFDAYMPMSKIATLLFEYKKDTLKTVEEINKHLMKWFDFWTNFLRDKRLEPGDYFSVVRITLKDLGIEWSDDEEDIA